VPAQAEGWTTYVCNVQGRAQEGDLVGIAWLRPPWKGVLQSVQV